MIENGESEGAFVLAYAGERVPFQVTYRCRKNLAISVFPDMRVEVVAPEGSSLDNIHPRVEKRAGWILKQLRFFEQYQPKHPDRKYISGETHLFLGRQYRLKVSEGTPETVKLIGRFFQIKTRSRQAPDRVEALLEGWYREHARRIFNQRLSWCIEVIPGLKLDKVPNVNIRMMEKRWGSCTKAGNILLNLNLIKVPVHCIDYVIVHELCHFQVHNHGKAFYRLMTRCMPDWERRKKRLESFVV